MKTVMVISDATGETAERMVRAATHQFRDEKVNVRTYSRVRLESEIERIIERAAELHALVVFTVVNNEARDLLLKAVERHNVEAIDLIGALIGTDDLGQLILKSLSDQQGVGNGLVLGLSVAFIGLAIDQVLRTWAEQRKRQLGLA